jgi:hypothetical protein
MNKAKVRVIKMRTAVYLMAFFLMLVTQSQGRVFLVGSNPSLTLLAFPQDLVKFQNDYAFYYLTYENKPWWSDVDDPPNKPVNESATRPNNTYLATGENIVDEDGNSFKHKSSINAIQNNLGIGYTLKHSIKARFDLRYSVWAMNSDASGSVGSRHFTYEEHNSFHEIYLNSMFAKTINDIPVGIKIGLGGIGTTEPELKTSGDIGDNQLYWGWSASDGALILPELAHALEQNQYSLGPLFELDLQAGATFPRLALGGRFRYNFGNIDTYNWSDSTNHYINDEANKISNTTYRLYGNHIWSEGEKYRFATLVLTRYTSLDTTQHAVGNVNVESGHVRELKNFVLQINPNISLYPWRTKQTYIDAAILINYSFMHFNHDYPYWVAGGQKKSHINSDVYIGDEYSWENCSYWNQNFFEIALDLNPVFPIYGNKDQSVAIGVMALIWTRFKWTNKYYGTNKISGSDIDFVTDNIRKNYDHETWLNSLINFIYRRNGIIYRLDVGQPLLYSLTPRTRITDANGKDVLYERRNENMWVSQSGVKLGLFVTTGFDNIKKLLSNPK